MRVLFLLLHFFHAQEWVKFIFHWNWERKLLVKNLYQTIDPNLLEDYEPYEYEPYEYPDSNTVDSVTVSNDVTVSPDCDLFYLDCDRGEMYATLFLDKAMFLSFAI